MGRLARRRRRRRCCGWPVATPRTGKVLVIGGQRRRARLQPSWHKTGALRAAPARRKPIRARLQRPARWHV